MKHLAKRCLSLLVVLALCLSMLPAISLSAEAVTSTSQYVTSSQGYIYNWGKRGETATYLSPNAEAYYADNNVTYASLSALSGSSTESGVPSSALYQKLHDIMESTHDYTTTYDATKNLYQYTDCQESGKGATGTAISSYYSGTSIGPSWDGSWNREHTWPNSKGKAGSDENDLMMLRPTASSENSARGNKAYGTSTGYYNPNSASNGKYDLRGDVVRTALGHYVRWEMYGYEYPAGSTFSIFGTNGMLESKELMLEWLVADPVDTWEMGRNDSAESILGYRNVFIDYPELAFVLFGEAVPDHTTPSGNAAASAYKITTAVNDAAYGSVTLSGRNITAIPATGYEVAGYTVTAGTATVTQNGNVFTVDASTDCTVQINFQARQAIKMRTYENGVLTSELDYYMDDLIQLPAPKNEAPAGYTFLGWYTLPIEETSTKPSFYTVGSNFTLGGLMNQFYAVYSRVVTDATVESNMFEKYTGAITEGDYVLVSNYGAMQASVSSDRFAIVSSLTFTDENTIIVSPDASAVWTVTAADEYYALYNEQKGVYAAGTGASNKGMLLSADAPSTYAKWTVTENNGMYVFENLGNENNGANYTLRRNANYGFALYAATTGTGIELYKRANGVVYYSTSAAPCEHANVVSVDAVPATCTESGFTAGQLCTDCNSYISGRELIAASGHNYSSVVTAPTETEQGYTTHTCSNCGDTYQDSFVAPTAPVTNVLTVKEAIDMGLAMSHDTYTEEKYSVTGVITEVYNTTYGNMKITDDAGNILTIYGTYSADGSTRYDAMEVKPVAGDTVTVLGIVGQYNDVAQIKNGWITEHIPGEPAETPDLPTKTELTIEEAITLGLAMGSGVYTPNKYQVTGVITEVYNTTYGNMRISDDAGNILTIYGTYSADGTTRYDAMEVKPVVGDTVTILGVVGQYNNVAQIQNGWLIAHTPGESEPDTPTAESATLDFSSKDNRTSFSTSEQIWQQNGVTLINQKGSSNSNVADYAGPARFYKNSSIEIQASNMAKIVFSANTAAYATALANSIDASTVASVTTSGSQVTVELSQPSDSFTIATLSGGQVRMNSLTVHFAKAETPSEGVTYSVSTSKSDLDRGDTVTFTVSVTSGDAATDYALWLSYDASVFEVVEGELTVEGADGYFDEGFEFSFAEATAYTGTVGTVTLVVKDDAEFGDYTVTFEASAMNGNTELPAENCEAEVSIACVHSYDEVVTEPTETEEGYTTYTCSKCGDTYVDDYTKPLGKTYTVTFVVPTGVEAIASKPCNDYGITLPVAGVPQEHSDYTFAGWTAAPVEKTEEAPEMYTTSGKFYTDADVTLYPVYVFTEGGSDTAGDFQLVTNAAQLTAGAEVIIAAKDYAYAMGTNQKSNNRAAAAVTKTGNTLTYGTDVAVFQLQAGTVSGTWAFYDALNKGYLYAASGSSNYLKTQTTNNDNGSWLITIAEDGTASVIAQGTNARNVMQYNNGSADNLLFSCYSSASQKAMTLYVRSTGGTMYYTSLYTQEEQPELVGDGETTYASLADAVESSSAEYLFLLDTVTEDLKLNRDLYLDLNGHDLVGNIHIGENATLYLFDSATSDYTAENRGSVRGTIEGNVATCFNTPESYGHNYKYLVIQEESALWSAHRIYLTVKSVSLSPDVVDEVGNRSTAMLYNTVFKCSDFVAGYVGNYGVAVGGETELIYAYEKELTGGVNQGTMRLYDTMDSCVSMEDNAADAEKDVSVSAWIQLRNGTEVKSAAVNMSLKDLVVAVSARADLTDEQKANLGIMYVTFQEVLDAWTDVDISNIKTWAEAWKR